MTAFLAIAALFVAAAIGAVAWPLLRRGKSATAETRAPATAAIVAAALPLAAFLIYFSLSNWNWSDPATTSADRW